MADKKGIALALLEILREHTDADHHLSATELINLLLYEYGYELERRTIYANINLLRQFGYEIEGWSKGNDGYALIEHQFTEKEAFGLCDLLKESKAFSPREKKKLKEKLLHTLSEHQRKRN